MMVLTYGVMTGNVYIRHLISINVEAGREEVVFQYICCIVGIRNRSHMLINDTMFIICLLYV